MCLLPLCLTWRKLKVVSNQTNVKTFSIHAANTPILFLQYHFTFNSN